MHHGDYRRIKAANFVLDIGAGAGALIIYTQSEFLGREIEVSLRGIDTQRVHTDVLQRLVSGRPVFAALFAELPPGEYTIWGLDQRPVGDVTIVDGEVAELDWR